MSKSLKKLIDINRLREFKNKLVGAGSAYVQTGAVDQTIAGTKTFSKPIAGSVTGSSGSCTGNAATATTATTAKSCTGNAATATQFSANATVALTGDATGTSAGSKKGWSVPVTLANSGVTAGTYGPSADVTGNNNATISVPEITVDAKGRVTSVVNRTLTCKNNTYTVNNATLTIQKNGTNVATFTSNASSNATANITVPTKVSELTNDSGFLTSHQSLSNYVTLNGAQTISGAKTFTGDVIGISKDNSTENANDLYSTTAGSKLTYYTTSNGGTRLTNVPDAINTTLESRTIRRLSDSDWIVEQICHNSNGLYYRKGSNGTWGAWKTFAFTDSNISGNAATATKLAAKRTIALSGAATGTATGFDGSGNITIPVTSLDASKLTGTASVSTTGNAATATTATTAKSCTGNAATATKLATARSLWGNNFDGSAAITGKITGTPAIEFMPEAITSNNGGFLDFHYNQSTADYTSRIIESASGTLSINNVTITTGKVVTATTFNGALKGNVTGNCSGSSGSCTGNAATATTATTAKSCTGNAATATKLQTARTINGTGFDGTANITTANWGTARNISITDGTNTSTAVSVNGSANVSLNLPSTIKATFVGNVTGNLTGNCSGSSGSCTGNATTATKLAAKRTIALSGAATGTATGFDGSGNITIPVTALAASAIRAQWYAAYPDGAEAHNSMWGGRDITAAFNNGTVSANIANGTFKDIFPGDYITKSITVPPILTTDSPKTYTVNWVIADCDYWWHKGDQNNGMETHHVVIVPQTPIFNGYMNNDNVTTGGYAGSWMYMATIQRCATGIVNAFGSDHILTFRDSISNSVDTSSISSGAPFWTGASIDWGWYDAQCNLMCERMVYGMPAYSSSARDAGVATRQFSAFRLSERLINYNRQHWWLRDVVSSARFALVTGDGSTGVNNASYVRGVRPFALLR